MICANCCFFAVVVILMIAAIVCGVPAYNSPSSTTQDFCKDKATQGSFADTSNMDCTRYLLCYNLNNEWQTKLLKCPKGQFFDSSLLICDRNYVCPLSE